MQDPIVLQTGFVQRPVALVGERNERMDDDARPACGGDARTVVGAAVVHHDDLGAVPQRPQTARQIGRFVVREHDRRDGNNFVQTVHAVEIVQLVETAAIAQDGTPPVFQSPRF